MQTNQNSADGSEDPIRARNLWSQFAPLRLDQEQYFLGNFKMYKLSSLTKMGGGGLKNLIRINLLNRKIGLNMLRTS